MYCFFVIVSYISSGAHRCVIDGFGASITGNRLHILYHVEPLLKEVHSSSFESDIESMVEKVKSFIQKEFKKVTGGSLSLSKPSEIDVLVEYISRIRTSVKAHKCWEIGSGSEAEPIEEESESHDDPVASATRKCIEKKWSGKKSENDSRKS